VTSYLPHIALMVVVLIGARSAPETVLGDRRGAVRLSIPAARHPRFRRVVGPMAPWVFATPAVAFALLPSIVGANRASDGIALTAAIASLVAIAGVLIQPVARRLEARGEGRSAGTVGLLVATVGLLLSAVAADAQEVWLLVPCALVLGSSYGMILVSGLIEVQRMAVDGAVAGLTAAYYVLTYLGFAAPYLLALAAHAAAYPVLLTITALLALGTATLVFRRGES
jgi:hypothetical protein